MAQVTGLDEVLRNLNREIEGIRGRTLRGMRKVGILIKGEAMDLAPVDAGVLMNSAFYSTEMTLSGPALRVGFTAKYAPAVHEMPMTLRGQPRADFGRTGNQGASGPQQVTSFGGGSGNGNYWDGGENKFLEKAVKRNTTDIIKIIRDNATVPNGGTS